MCAGSLVQVTKPSQLLDFAQLVAASIQQQQAEGWHAKCIHHEHDTRPHGVDVPSAGTTLQPCVRQQPWRAINVNTAAQGKHKQTVDAAPASIARYVLL